MWLLQIRDYDGVLKSKDILTHVTTWRHLKDIVTSELSPSRKDKYHMILLLWSTYRIVKFIEIGVKLWVPGVGRTGWERGGGVQYGQSFSWEDERVLEMDAVMAAQLWGRGERKEIKELRLLRPCE